MNRVAASIAAAALVLGLACSVDRHEESSRSTESSAEDAADPLRSSAPPGPAVARLEVRAARLFGGTQTDYVQDVAVGPDGSIYATGYTGSADFPVRNPVQGRYAGCLEYACSDAFVIKFDPKGERILYATFLGGGVGDGGGHDYGNAIAVAGDGSVFVAGTTFSSDFPTTDGAFKQEMGTGDQVDAFVAKLDPDGTRLVYATLLGGGLGEPNQGGNIAGDDGAEGLAVDAEGNAYVTGQTDAKDFPVQDPVQAVNGGGTDAFIAKLAPEGDRLLFSSFLGGTSDDKGAVVDVDDAGAIYVAGETQSTDFPTSRPLQENSGNTAGGGLDDGFVAKIEGAPTGGTLAYATYLGGAGDDVIEDLALDGRAQVHVAGTTASRDFPTTGRAYQRRSAGGEDAFVAGLTADGQRFLYATFFGGGARDFAEAISVSPGGSIYVTGGTASRDLPVRKAVQPKMAARYDAFALKLDEEGRRLRWSTYLGGTEKAAVPLVDNGTGIAFTGSKVVVVGVSRSRRLACCATKAFGARRTSGFLAVLREIPAPAS